MVCKTTEIEILPITTYELKNIHVVDYEVIPDTTPKHDIETIREKEYEFRYCVSFRDPNLPEWILARWWWNDKGIWTPDGIFPA